MTEKFNKEELLEAFEVIKTNAIKSIMDDPILKTLNLGVGIVVEDTEQASSK